MKAAWLLVLAACTDAPCDGVTGTCVILHVTSPAVKTIDRLDVDMLAGSFHGTATTSDGQASLPLETGLELALSGDLDLGIVAAGELGGTVVGTGSARVTVGDGQHATASVELIAPEACTDGQLYCGGDAIAGSTDTLYKCQSDGVPLARGVCPGACLVRPAKNGDVCAGVDGPCMGNGFYCGGDKVDGDPQSLYQCAGSAAPTFVKECANGCVVGSSGHDDACR